METPQTSSEATKSSSTVVPFGLSLWEGPGATAAKCTQVLSQPGNRETYNGDGSES